MSPEIEFPSIDVLDLSSELIEKLKKASNLIKSTNKPVRVISHYDADGLTSGAVIIATLMRLQKQFHISLHHGIEPNSKFFSDLEESKAEVKIFSDMGTGQLDDIEKLPDWSIIIDHHRVERDTDAKNVIHINSNIFNYNGSEEISAATLALLLAIYITPKNWDLIHIALAGAIGDKQNKNGFSGINLKLLNKALKFGLIIEKINFKPHGDTLLNAIVHSTDPYIVGFSNNKTAVKELLKSLNISIDAKIEELDKDAIQRLASYLAIKLLEQGVPPEDAEGIVTKKYQSKTKDIDLEEFSHQINACGRMNRMGVGVAAALGDPKAVEIAKKLRSEYKQKIRSGLKRLEEKKPEELEHIQYFYEEIPEFAGTYAGLGMMYFFNQNKPVIALTKTDKNIKISGRGTKRLVKRGLDLANILASTAAEFDGNGGGHNIASGATIPLGTDKKFLDKVNILVAEQLKSENDS